MAFYQLDPWGAQRDNLHFAQLTAWIANIHRGKHTSAYKVADFMYRNREDCRQRETRQFITALDTLAKPKNG